MSFRFSRVVAGLLVLGVWGCVESSPPEPSKRSVSVLVDSVQTAVAEADAEGLSPQGRRALQQWSQRLLALGDSLASPEPNRAQELLQEALRAGRVLGDSALVAGSLTNLGEIKESRSAYDEALEQYRTALSINRSLGREENIANCLKKIGDTFRHEDNYSKALESYREALLLYRDVDNRRIKAQILHNVGVIHEAKSRYEQALGSYRESLSVKREIGNREGMASTLNNLGIVHYRRGQYEKTLDRWTEALSIKREIGNRHEIATTLNNLGVLHLRQGRYEEALAEYREALSIRRDIEDREGIASTLNNIGLTHQRQGRYKDALVRYRKALSLKREIGDRKESASTLNNIGLVLDNQGKYHEALDYYKKSLEIKRALGDREGVARTLNNIGLVFEKQAQYEKALARLRESHEIRREIGNRRGVARALHSIGMVYDNRKEYSGALDRYRRAHRINHELGNRPGMADNLRGIGEIHLKRQNLSAATDTLARAVDLAETLRQNATSGGARRSLLSTQIEAYRGLSLAYVSSNQPDAALRSVEKARARLLTDRLTESIQEDTTFAVPPVATLRQSLDPDQAALLYVSPGSDFRLTALVTTRDTTYVHPLPDATVRDTIQQSYRSQLRRLREEEGPLTAALENEGTAPPEEQPSLAEVIRLYRHYLTREEATDSPEKALGRQLYGLLLEPLKQRVEDTETLVIVPTGSMGYLPFETLRDGEGRYLVQDKQVRYAQSLTVLHQLQRRPSTSSGLSTSRQSLLAFGGAAYGASPSIDEGPLLASARGEARVGTRKQAATFLRSAKRRMDRGMSPHPTYAQLGHAEWQALPGTKLEVNKLKRVFGEDASIYTGHTASEEQVRQLSESGRLSDYRWLHFATHGIAVPEAPELSALVLSQESASDSLAERDGYLTMQEITDLNLNADVTVLSACRSGIGRIIAGEGVVSLSHAFLRAGANATLVSQWRVRDWSTQQFMTAVYRRVEEDGLSFSEATTHVKRAFINGTFGGRNTDPLRWAPFVYYGREER